MYEDDLTGQDVKNLSTNPSPENKSNIADKLGSIYGRQQLSPNAVKLAEAIFRIMVRDAETQVRQALSESLKKNKNIPSDIVQSILNDEDCVAIPFIQYYASLTDDDLIKIIDSNKLPRQKAVASRSSVSLNVSDYIVEKCPSDVVGTLISNEGSHIGDNTFSKIVEKYDQNDDIKTRMVYRSELPVLIIEKIVDKISSNLKKHLMLHHNLPKNMVSTLVDEIKETIALNISEDFSTDKQTEEFVHQLYKANRLTAGLVIRALCLGDLSFFEYALVYLSETPISEVRKVLFNSQADFMIRNLLRKAFIPKSMFPAVFSALKIIREIRFDCGRPNRKKFGHKVAERILTYIENNDELSSDDIQYLISKIN